MLGNYALRDVASGTVGLPDRGDRRARGRAAGEAAMILGAFESLCERYGVRPPVGLAALIGSADPLESARAGPRPGDVRRGLWAAAVG